MIAYIICCNHSIELVVIGNKKIANEKLKELRKISMNESYKTAETYNYQNHWHIMTSDIFKKRRNKK